MDTKPPTVQEVNEATQSPEKAVPREIDIVRRAIIQDQRMASLARIHEILPGQADAIDNVGYELQLALANYLIRPGSDPEVIDLVRDVVRQLANIGSGDERRLSEEQLLNLKAGLVGATMVLQGARDSGRPPVQPQSHAEYASRFLDLVDKRVGDDDPSTGKRTLWVVLSDSQKKPSISFQKNAPKKSAN